MKHKADNSYETSTSECGHSDGEKTLRRIMEKHAATSSGRDTTNCQPQRSRFEMGDLAALVLQQQHMIVTEQILLRAVMKELIKRCADGTAEPLEVVREMAQSLSVRCLR